MTVGPPPVAQPSRCEQEHVCDYIEDQVRVTLDDRDLFDSKDNCEEYRDRVQECDKESEKRREKIAKYKSLILDEKLDRIGSRDRENSGRDGGTWCADCSSQGSSKTSLYHKTWCVFAIMNGLGMYASTINLIIVLGDAAKDVGGTYDNHLLLYLGMGTV